MVNAREIMTPGAHIVHTDETVAYAARLMAEHRVGALVLCGPEETVRGVVTDRDVVRQVVAADHDAATWPVGRLERGENAATGHTCRQRPVRLSASSLAGTVRALITHRIEYQT